MPYAAWRPVFAAMLGDPQPSAPSTRGAASGPHRPRSAIRSSRRLINAVVPGFLEETPLVQSLSGQARADATSTVLSEIIAAHATARFVLVLEDCHWMDSASWRLVLRVAQDYPQALIVLTSRPVTDVQELSALQTRLERFAEMKLSPLALERHRGRWSRACSADRAWQQEVIERDRAAIGRAIRCSRASTRCC